MPGSSGVAGRPDGPVLAVEVGGTTIRAARFDAARHRLVERRCVMTPNHLRHGADPRLEDRVAAAVVAIAGDVLGGAAPLAIGLAWPGPVDPSGRVLATPTVYGTRGWTGDIRGTLERRWPAARVTVVNDLTAAGYRYVAAGLRDFAILTVGSGIGHKVFLDARPQLGPGGRGGEIGHLRLDPSEDAPLCDCGGRGHLGGLASGRGTVALARHRACQDPMGFAESHLGRSVDGPSAVDGPKVAAAFAVEDRFTVEVVRAAAGHVGVALAALHLAVGVECFVIMGGFALALGEPYRRLLVASAAEAGWFVGQDWNGMVRLGEPDDDSGLLGAGALAVLGLAGVGIR